MTALGLLLAISAEALALAFGHLSNGLNYYRAGKQDMALREFGIVLSDYRGTPAADDALYWSAMAEQARGDRDKAGALLAELARLYPASPYVAAAVPAPATAVAPAPAPATPVVAEPVKVAAATPTPTPAPAGIPPVTVGIRKRGEVTSLEMNGIPFKSTGEFEAAITDLRRSRQNLTVLLRQDPGVDLQAVIDVMNVCDKLQINIRTQ